MTLALLLMAVTGAWAQTAFGVKEITADMLPASWSTDNSAVTADDLAKLGFMEVTKDAAKTWTGAPQQGNVRLIYTVCKSVNWVNGEGGYVTDSYTRKIFYSCLDGQKIFITTEITEWPLTSQDGKTWTLAKMPGSNVELQVEYYAESNLFLGKEALANKANISVLNGQTAVTFGDDGKSTATVTEGNTVTVKYNGTKKLLGMKVEKMAVAEGHALTSAKFGEIVCSDGKAYAAADKNILPKGVKAEALVCYVDGDHGLALAMADVKDEKMSWDNDRGANDGKTAAEWCTGWNTSHPITGATWLLASKTQWDNMINAAGSASNLSNAFSAVGGTNLQAFSYWSSTPNHGGTAAWFYYFPSSAWQWTYLNQDDTGKYIRACLQW